MLKLYTSEKNFPMSFLVLANPELSNSNQFIVVAEMAGPEVSFIQRLRCMLPNAHVHTAETLLLKMIVLLGLDD